MNKRTLFLFGLAGVGKSCLAKYVADNFGYYLYEGDEDITPAMRSAIAGNRDFTDQMRDEFFEQMTEKILMLQKEHEYIVVAQGLYKNEHRRFLLEKISSLELLWVTASDAVISQRLLKRDGVSVSPEYAEIIKKNFELPDIEVQKVHNEGELREVVLIMEDTMGLLRV